MIGVRSRVAVATLALTAGGMFAASGAHASPVGPECFGDSNANVCATVDPTGGTPITDCVFVGPPPCMPVVVPTPTGSVVCGGTLLVQLCEIEPGFIAGT